MATETHPTDDRDPPAPWAGLPLPEALRAANLAHVLHRAGLLGATLDNLERLADAAELLALLTLVGAQAPDSPGSELAQARCAALARGILARELTSPGRAR